MVSSESSHFLRLYRHYDAGFLYAAGGIENQPNVYLEAMECIGAELARIRRDEMEKIREGKKGAG